ncbi:MAG: hypothetical protein SFX73_31470 [Kofleriaceae bacterium]|nr:hypothetical protein [Kofleriaceae bacterium]
MKLRTESATDLAIVGALAVLFLVLGGHIVRQVIAFTLPGGWDGTAHYAVTELYVRNHFPAPHGWMPEYFGGMAFPDYYPPLLYWLAGALSYPLGSTLIAINVMFIGATFAIVCVSYDLARRLGGSRPAAALVTLFVIQMLVDGGEQARFGIAIRATFSVGLASNVLGYLVLLITIRMALASTRRRRVFGTGLMLGLTILSNLHIAIDAAALFGFALGFQLLWGPRGERLDLVISGVIGLALSALFWLPMIAEAAWLPTYAMPPRFPGATVIIPMAFAGGLAGWWASRRRDPWTAALAATGLMSAGLCVVDLAALMPDAPLQPWRLAAAGMFLMPIAVAGPVGTLLDRGLIAKLVVATVAIAYALTFHRATVFEYPLTTARERSYDRVFAALKGRPSGRVLVEAGGDGADAYGLHVLLPLRGHASATGVFREASIGSLFATPLQTRFSESERVFGIDTKVDVNVLYTVTDPKALASLLRAFDITHFVAHSARIKELVAEIPGTRMLGGADWTVFELPWAPALVVAPAYAPVLVAAPFTVKKRTGTTDFVRLSEELLARGVGEYTVALQHGCALTDTTELMRFRVLLVLERCGEPQTIEATLRPFIAQGGIVLANKRAVAELAADLVASMHVADPTDVLVFYDDIVALMRAHVPAEPARPAPTYRAGREQVAIDVPTGEVRPIVVRSTYHPQWKASKGDIYMSTFAQQLVFADGPLVVELQRSRNRLIGYVVSALTLLGVVLGWRRFAR